MKDSWPNEETELVANILGAGGEDSVWLQTARDVAAALGRVSKLKYPSARRTRAVEALALAMKGHFTPVHFDNEIGFALHTYAFARVQWFEIADHFLPALGPFGVESVWGS